MEEKTNYMSNEFIEQANETDDWTDLFIATIDKAMQKTNVASLAFVSKADVGSVNGIKIAQVQPFPLDQGQEPFNIEAYYNPDYKIWSSSSRAPLKDGSIVVILYTDKPFKNNLDFDTPKVVSTKPNELHDISNAVIIHTLKY